MFPNRQQFYPRVLRRFIQHTHDELNTIAVYLMDL